MDKRPNILLFVVDQWRGDCLGAAGHPNVKTPFIDTLAHHGVMFSHAYSAVPSCIAARCSMFTGMTQEHHGRLGYQDRVRWQYENTMPGCFTKAGYQTQCVGKMHVHPLRNRLGFENIKLHDGYLHSYLNENVPACEYQLRADDYMHMIDGLGHKNLLDNGIECNGWETRPWCYDESLHPTRWVADETIDFLRSRDRDCPFFLMSSFVRPHSPLDPPEDYMNMYRGKPMKEPPVGDWAEEVGPLNNTDIRGMADPEQREEAQRAYYALMTQIDHQIGRIIEVLMTNGDLNNTYIMFVADHGDMMGDHNLYRKSLPYEGSAHVPLILLGPGIPANRTLDCPMELMDVMPTLLDICGIEIPDTVDGQSAMPIIRGEKTPREWVHGEHSYGPLSNHYIATGKDKFIWLSVKGEEQYFDLEKDPEETHNAVNDPEYAERVSYLRQILIDTLKDREEGYVQDGMLCPIKAQKNILSFLEPLAQK